MSRFIANRTLTSLTAIYRHYGATTKAERKAAVSKGYAALSRSARGREVKGKIENRRAASRKAAQTRRETKERAKTGRLRTVEWEGETFTDFERFPDVPARHDRNYAQAHAYVVRLEWLTMEQTAQGPVGHTTYTMVTFLSHTPMTNGDIGRQVWADYGNPMEQGPMGESDTGGEELTGWEVVAHYISSTKGRKTHAA